ncbi:MAG: nicotinate (nicotinamide) nucleotide adenylyltransferase [Candidatus Levybacteria bacterium]|nr:nicotinate (nicotinamide) nucleotide adenylyltransferase [Candidatus Levybacteria bacterium]
MKLAVLGGRFDPIHTGHILVARQVLELVPDIDKVLFIPANKHQWKSTVADANDRMEMIKLCLEYKMEVSDIELKRKGISYSIDTIRALKQERGAQIFWIIGSDIVTEFDRWKKADELVKEATFLVFPRDPYDLPTNLPVGFELISGPNLLVTSFSGTAIRERVKTGKSIKYLVPEPVERYIKENKLYV